MQKCLKRFSKVEYLFFFGGGGGTSRDFFIGKCLNPHAGLQVSACTGYNSSI